MARRIICDGCDMTLTPTTAGDVEVAVKVEHDNELKLNLLLDLCPGCLVALVHQANPKNWVRNTYRDGLMTAAQRPGARLRPTK